MPGSLQQMKVKPCTYSVLYGLLGQWHVSVAGVGGQAECNEAQPPFLLLESSHYIKHLNKLRENDSGLITIQFYLSGAKMFIFISSFYSLVNFSSVNP